MSKKYCPVGQRLDSHAADFQRQVVAETRRLAKYKRPDIDTSTLDRLKSQYKEVRKFYRKHADTCDICEV